MSDYQPPIRTSDRMISLISQISETLGEVTVMRKGSISPKLRRENRIKAIHSTLAIEQNTLSLSQVTAIVEGNRGA